MALMANEPKAPAQLHRSLNERWENSDKQGEIELYYEMLSSGYSVREILNGVGPVRGNSEQDRTAVAEQPQSGRDSAQTDCAAEVAAAGISRANAQSTRGLNRFGEAETRRTAKSQGAPSEEPGLDGWKPRSSESLAGAGPQIIASAGADASGGHDAAFDFGDQERFWSRKLPSMAASIGFWALYSGAVASASIAGFLLLRGGRDANPTTAAVQAKPFYGFEAVAMPGASVDRPALAAEVMKPSTQSVSLPGAPDLAVPGALQRVAVVDRETVSADRLEAGATQTSNAADPDPIGQLVERLTEPAEARASSAPAPQVIQSLSAALAKPTETAAPPDGGEKKADEKPQAAVTKDAKATRTGPPGEATAAPPPRTHAADSRHAHAPRRDAGLRRSAGRRTRASYPQPEHAATRTSPGPNRGTGAYDVDVARGYGQGAYGPAPYSDLGN